MVGKNKTLEKHHIWQETDSLIASMSTVSPLPQNTGYVNIGATRQIISSTQHWHTTRHGNIYQQVLLQQFSLCFITFEEEEDEEEEEEDEEFERLFPFVCDLKASAFWCYYQYHIAKSINTGIDWRKVWLI